MTILVAQLIMFPYKCFPRIPCAICADTHQICLLLIEHHINKTPGFSFPTPPDLVFQPLIVSCHTHRIYVLTGKHYSPGITSSILGVRILNGMSQTKQSLCSLPTVDIDICGGLQAKRGEMGV